MPQKRISQKTLVAVSRALREHLSPQHELEAAPDSFELLYENDFPDWFITHSRAQYGFDWHEIFPALRNGRFFFPHTYFGGPGDNITGKSYLSKEEARLLGETLIEHLSALASTLAGGEAVLRSLELDGFRVSKSTLGLVPLDSVTSEQEEEDRVTALIKQCAFANETTILKHISDAHELFLQGKDHPSINEARNFIQVLLDTIGGDTAASGSHSISYPGGMANRLTYLEQVGFFTTEEKTAFGAAWGFLSAGSHPGIPTRDEARIALILCLEFGLLLLLKFANWKGNGFRQFS